MKSLLRIYSNYNEDIALYRGRNNNKRGVYQTKMSRIKGEVQNETWKCVSECSRNIATAEHCQDFMQGCPESYLQRYEERVLRREGIRISVENGI